MAMNMPLPVKGYVPQSDDRVALVNEFKVLEEKLLRKLDDMDGITAEELGQSTSPYDRRWLSIGYTHLQQAVMAINRAVFQPQRISLEEDK